MHQQLRWRWDNQDPFGANAPDSNPAGLGNFTYNLRFPGQYYDQETGLFYNGFRDYDPATGQYVESDPIGLDGGLNTYSYVGGSPVNKIDPFGLHDIPQPFPWPNAPQNPVQLCIDFPVLCAMTIPLKVIEAACPSNDNSGDDCNEIIDKIQDVMKQLNRRYLHQCRDKKNQWKEHVQAYENTQRQLAKLVAEAEAKGCAVPPKAYEWLQTQCPTPGTPRNTTPGY